MPVIKQVGGTHYSASQGKCPHCNGVIQHWDVAANLPGLEYAATKYIWRHAAKAGFEDLKKAISYVEKRMAIDYPAEYATLLDERRAVVLRQLNQRAQEAVQNHNGARCPPIACSVCEGEGFHRPGCRILKAIP